MTAIAAQPGSAPVAWRQLRAEPEKLAWLLVLLQAPASILENTILYFCSRDCKRHYSEEGLAAWASLGRPRPRTLQ